MTAYPRFGGDDARRVDYAGARCAILSAPYEGTVSYAGGTAQGPLAILEASANLEMYDEELDRGIDQVGLYTLPPVDTSQGSPEAVMQRIHDAALPPLRDGKLLVTLGGEHSVSHGPFTALREVLGRPFSILQLDAHADLRPSYRGQRHSHACIMARAHDLGLPFVQVGIRSLSAEERRFLRDTGLEERVFWMHRLAQMQDDAWMDEVLALLTDPVYVTIDIDGLDPGLVPTTGTPEPGGLGWYQTLRLLRRVAERFHIPAFDLTELAPAPGFHAPDFLAARLVYKLIGYATQRAG